MIRAAAGSVANICIYPLAGRPPARQRSAHEHAPPPPPATGPGVSASTISSRNSPPSLCAITEMTDRDGYQKPIEGESAGSPTDSAALRILEGATR